MTETGIYPSGATEPSQQVQVCFKFQGAGRSKARLNLPLIRLAEIIGFFSIFCVYT